MSIEERSFFIAAGESLRQCEAWYASYKAGLEAAKAWQAELGAESVSFDRHLGVNGMKLNGKRVPGWRKNNRAGWEGWAYLGIGTKAAWAARKRADTMRPVPAPGKSHVEGGYYYGNSVGLVGDKWIISQHKNVKDAPVDAIPIKRSEYLAMMEEADAVNAA